MVLAVAALAGCSGGGTRYTGSFATEQGVCGTGFDAGGKASATLIVDGDDVHFAPTDGVTVLTGHISAAGHILAASTAPGADHKPFQQVFEGDRSGDRVAGRFASPRCRAAVVLDRR